MLELNSFSNTASQGKKKKTIQPGQTKLNVYFGSQTGTAEDFANTFAKLGECYNFFCEVIDLESVEPSDLEDVEFAAFCISTYGEGEPPDTVKDFWDNLLDENCPELSGLKYSIFGLGDSSYEFFNQASRTVDKRLLELGATRMGEKGEGDDDKSLHQDFDTWNNNIWKDICESAGVPHVKTESKIEATYTLKSQLPTVKMTKKVTWKTKGFINVVIDEKNPMLCNITEKKELHSEKSDRSCLHLEVKMMYGMKYQPGDHVGVYAENHPDDVEEWIKYFGEDGDRIITVQGENGVLAGPCSIRYLLSYFVDIISPPRKRIFNALHSLYTEDEEEKERLKKLGASDEEGWKLYNEYVKDPERTLMEVLKDFPKCKPDLAHIIELSPVNKPRYYSISSSQKETPQHVHITAVLVEYQTKTGRTHKGLCTNYFARKSVGEGIYCFIRSSSFRLPKQQQPVVMIGPGTGIAPFRGFLQERRHLENKGEAILFFGCRSKDIDYLYKDELEKHIEDGSLTRLITAFSREGPEKVYVQHKLRENATEIYELLNSGGYLYVCGDAKSMAKDVHKEIKEMAIGAGKSIEEAEEFVSKLQSSGRYQQDVW